MPSYQCRGLPRRARLLFESVESRQNLFAVMRGIDAGPHFDDLAFGIDEKRIPRREVNAHHASQRAVLRHDFLIGIGQKLESEPLFRAKLFVAAGGIHADAQDDRVGLLVLGEVALEIMRFDGATGRAVLRIKIEHDPLSMKIFGTESASVLRRQHEAWGLFAHLWN